MRILIGLVVVLVALSPAVGADLTGKWTGTVAVKLADGHTETQDMHLDLVQKEGTVTGTTGTEPGEELPIEEVKLADGKLSFTVTGQDGRVYKVKLAEKEENRLGGTLDLVMPDGTPLEAAVDLKRTK